MAIALRGQGASPDGRPIRFAPADRPARGYIGFKVRKEFDRQLAPQTRHLLGGLTSLNCAGREYIAILGGEREFNLYRRTKPWDHAAGALMVEEAGGLAQRFDGSPYDPAGSTEGGIISAVAPKVMAEVRSVYEAVQMPLLAVKPM